MSRSFPEQQAMLRYSLRITLILDVILSAICLFAFRYRWILGILAGLWLGSAAGMLSLRMIWSQMTKLGGDETENKKKGRSSYILRYLMYLAVLASGALLGASAAAMLVGLAVQKASLIFYALSQRKES